MLLTQTILPGLFVAVGVQGATQASSDCKCMPGDSCWPSEADFEALNQTVAGHLIQGVPPGSVCYPEQPNYNETACQYVRDSWLQSTFHYNNPVSIGWPQWAGNPCPPIFPNGTSVNGDIDAGVNGCKMGGYPAYALNATDTLHVQAVVKFVNDKNIRLNVKSTGHSFVGTSTATGSISIWTHGLKGIDYYENFQPDSCPTNSTQMAFKIGAGSRVRDIYEAANDYNTIVVAGSAQDVGIAGWFLGGGHGPLSQTYGMGVDNVLQVTVVTPAGDLVVANECLEPDLFWAIRGGGPVFGVVTDVVMKAYPSPQMEIVSFTVEPLSADDEDEFWDSAGYFYSEFPRLKEGGLSGYVLILNPSVTGTGFPSIVGSLSVFNASHGTGASLFAPLKSEFASRFPAINLTADSAVYPSFFENRNTTIGYEPVGGLGGILGSRLLPASALTTDPSRLSSVFRNLTSATQGVQTYMIANSDNAQLNVSLNPAWRTATIHTITAWGFPDNATAEEQAAAYEHMTNDLAPQLKGLAPDSGAYINESDQNDPNFAWTFFGENYQRLRNIKKRYDPNTVLWCEACVGGEEWVPENKFFSGYGQGRICRAEGFTVQD